MSRLLSCRNQVLVKRKYKNEEQQTESGVFVIADSSFRPALHADRIAEVVLVPPGLYYHKHSYSHYQYGGESMPWDCDMELQVGDTVVHTFMNRDDIVNIEVEDEPGELYRMMPYDDIYVARRGDEVIPLNGYCLCEEVEKESMSDVLEIILCDKEGDIEAPIDKTVGKIAYVGKPNRAYRGDGWERDLDGDMKVNVGDTVIKRRSDIHIRLEEDLHNKFFDSPVMYFIIQRKDIYGVKVRGTWEQIEKENIRPHNPGPFKDIL